MKILKPSVELISEKDPFKKIELAGRTCYQSLDGITEESARKFVIRMIENRHFAMLEHATFIFEVDRGFFERLNGCKFLNFSCDDRYLVSGNLRALNEEPNAGSLLSELQIIFGEGINYGTACSYFGEQIRLAEPKTPKEKLEHEYFTFCITTDRGTMAELTRHRTMSFAVESTRYVNYAKDGELSFIFPEFLSKEAKKDGEYWQKYNLWIKTMEKIEKNYMHMIAAGCTPQEARDILPNSLKTTIVMTGNRKAWDHFIDLRYYEDTGMVHPNMKKVAEMIYDKVVDSKEGG